MKSTHYQIKIKSTQITALENKNGKFLSEILLSQDDDVSEVKWRGNIIKVTACEGQQFESMTLEFLDHVLLNLEKRFPVDSTNVHVVYACGILSLHNVHFQNENLSTNGYEELWICKENVRR